MTKQGQQHLFSEVLILVTVFIVEIGEGVGMKQCGGRHLKVHMARVGTILL